MKSKKRVAAVSLAATCALAGAAAGISESSAAKTKSSAKTVRHSAAGLAGGPHGGGGPGGRAVHAVEQVLNKAGTAYIEQTEDNGTITAVDASGGSITLKEGTSSVTYATPTITIPSGATVTLDGASSSLEKLAVGDNVSIESSSDGTTVFATDSSFKSQGGPGGHMGGPPPSGSTPSGSAPSGSAPGSSTSEAQG